MHITLYIQVDDTGVKRQPKVAADNKHSPVGCTRRQAGKGLDRKNPPWSLNSRPELLCSDDDIPAEWYMSGSRGDAIPCEFSQQQA
jgi:hypothetical protein